MASKRELCPHCGQTMPRGPGGPFDLYLAEVLGYGTWNPTKVGIGKDARARVKSIDCIGTRPLALRHIFRFSTERRAREVEHSVKKQFPKWEYADDLHTEVLAIEITVALAFVRSIAADAEHTVVEGS